jgi:hypothetical protein
MRKTVVLVFTAAALLMAAAVALEQHGRDADHYHRAALDDLPPFYIHPLQESWERAADAAWLLAVGVLFAGIRLSADEPQPPHRVSMLGLPAGGRRRIARADAARPARPRDDGLTPLERVIRGY